MSDTADYLNWLETECGYGLPCELPGNRWTALFAREFNIQILTGTLGDYLGWDDAW
jgi:hypothetical protein